MNNLEETTDVSKDVWATLIIGAVFSFIAWLIKKIIEVIKDNVQSKKEIKSKKEIWTETRIIETYQKLRIVIIEYDTDMQAIEDCYKKHQRLLKQLLDEFKTNMQEYKLD